MVIQSQQFGKESANGSDRLSKHLILRQGKKSSWSSLETQRFLTFLPTPNEVCEGYVFTPGQVSPRPGTPRSDQVHPPMTRYTPLWAGTLTPWTRYPAGTRYTQRDQVQPPSSTCWEIRATSGWYASYWNAFFFNFVFTRIFIEQSCLCVAHLQEEEPEVNGYNKTSNVLAIGLSNQMTPRRRKKTLHLVYLFLWAETVIKPPKWPT